VIESIDVHDFSWSNRSGESYRPIAILCCFQ
jgi:hypothetical protein